MRSCSAAHHVLHRPLRFSVLQQVSDNSRASKTILFTLPAQFDIELRLVRVSAPAGPVYIVRTAATQGILPLRPAAPATPGHRLPRLLRLQPVQFSEEFSHFVQQACDALATAAVITATVHYDNNSQSRLQFGPTVGIATCRINSICP